MRGQRSGRGGQARGGVSRACHARVTRRIYIRVVGTYLRSLKMQFSAPTNCQVVLRSADKSSGGRVGAAGVTSADVMSRVVVAARRMRVISTFN